MRAIRAWHATYAQYCKMFRELAGLSFSDFYKALSEIPPIPKSPDCTDRLTALRSYFSSKGYAKEVEQADERFLREHRGYRSEEAWEEAWEQFCKHHNINSREDAL